MADHSKPTSASPYVNFVSELDGRFDDLALGLDPAYVTATNLPTNTLRFSSASAKWQRWNGSGWVDPVATYAISISGNAATVTNGVYSNGTYANPSWISSLAGSKITGNISGNAASATVLATARNINGISFNGAANIDINLNNSITFNNAGSGAASGVTFNGGSAITVSYNTVGAPSTAGVGASGTWGISITGNAATATSANTAAAVLSTVSNRVGDLAFGSGEGLIYSYDANALAIRVGAAGSYKQHNFAASGDINFAAGIAAAGDVTAYSDERLKQNWRDLPADFLERLAQVKMGVYDRKDTGETQVGVGAQSLQNALPQSVRDVNGFLTVAYGNAALASCVLLAREVMNLKAELAALKG